MHFRRNLSIIFFYILISLNDTQVFADNTNPPLVDSFEEVTSGPYTVGDIVVYKVSYTGGMPGIKKITINRTFNSNSCVTQAPFTTVTGLLSPAQINLNWFKKTVIEVSDSQLISGFVVPCNGIDLSTPSVIVSIEDETGLINSKSFPYKLITKEHNFYTKNGEIKPAKIPDQVSITSIPKYPKKGTSFQLPRITQGGVPIFWFTPDGSNNPKGSVCSIERNFENDLGGKLKFKKIGICYLNAWPQPTDKYTAPKYVANVQLTLDERSGEKNTFIFKIK